MAGFQKEGSDEVSHGQIFPGSAPERFLQIKQELHAHNLRGAVV